MVKIRYRGQSVERERQGFCAWQTPSPGSGSSCVSPSPWTGKAAPVQLSVHSASDLVYGAVVGWVKPLSLTLQKTHTISHC